MSARIWVAALFGSVALTWGCGGGGGTASGTIRSSGGSTTGSTSGGTTGGGTGSTTGISTTAGGTTGPTIGAPIAPTVYTLVTTDNPTRTALPESISGAEIATAAGLIQLPTSLTTNGNGHQIFTSSGFAASPDRRFLFVGHNSSNIVESFLTRTDGSISPAPGGIVQVEQAACIVANPIVNAIYVTRTTAGAAASKVEAFSYDTTTAALAPLTSLTVADSVRGITVDPTGRFLVTTHMFGPGIGFTIYLLDVRGVPQATPIQNVALSSGRPKDAFYDRSGTRLYVRDIDRGLYAYSVGATGTVTALNGGASYTLSGASYYSDAAANPRIDFVYLLSALSTHLLQPYRIDAGGTLTPVGQPVNLNDDCQHMAVARAGSSLFITSRSTSRIHGYAIDSVSGGLIVAPGSPFAIVNPAGVTGAILADD